MYISFHSYLLNPIISKRGEGNITKLVPLGGRGGNFAWKSKAKSVKKLTNSKEGGEERRVGEIG